MGSLIFRRDRGNRPNGVLIYTGFNGHFFRSITADSNIGSIICHDGIRLDVSSRHYEVNVNIIAFSTSVITINGPITALKCCKFYVTAILTQFYNRSRIKKFIGLCFLSIKSTRTNIGFCRADNPWHNYNSAHQYRAQNCFLFPIPHLVNDLLEYLQAAFVPHS